MPSNCAVYSCYSNSKYNKNITFHGFPKDKELRSKWVQLCRRQDKFNVDNARICSLHFEESAFERNLKYELLGIPVPKRIIKFKEGALPTKDLISLFLFSQQWAG